MSDVFIATDDMSVVTELRKERPDWSFSVATDARAGQTLLEAAQNMQVMLLDRRSRWVDETLMSAARDMHPDAVCVALVPDLAVSDAVRNSRLAHQVLSASSDVATVAGVCDRAIAVRRIVTNSDVRDIVTASPDLAAPPELWQELNRVLEDPDSTANAVANVVASDPAIAAQIMRLANSAFFGLSRHITQLRDAVSLLGYTTIRALVLEAASVRVVPNTMPDLRRNEIQKHSLGTARVARQIAGAGHTSDAFLSGLLMDVGEVLLSSVRTDDFREAIKRAEERNVGLYVTEQEIFGFNHAAVSACLLGLWGMPYSVLDAVAHHHDRPDLAATLTVRETLYLARDATQVYGPADPYDVSGGLIHGVAGDMTVSLLVDSARSVAAELDADVLS